jgi:hypothetical protein
MVESEISTTFNWRNYSKQILVVFITSRNAYKGENYRLIAIITSAYKTEVS